MPQRSSLHFLPYCCLFNCPPHSARRQARQNAVPPVRLPRLHWSCRRGVHSSNVHPRHLPMATVPPVTHESREEREDSALKKKRRAERCAYREGKGEAGSEHAPLSAPLFTEDC